MFEFLNPADLGQSGAIVALIYALWRTSQRNRDKVRDLEHKTHALDERISDLHSADEKERAEAADFRREVRTTLSKMATDIAVLKVEVKRTNGSD